MTRRVVQIAVAGTAENRETQSDAIVMALDNFGCLWRSDNRALFTERPWIPVPNIPEARESTEAACQALARALKGLVDNDGCVLDNENGPTCGDCPFCRGAEALRRFGSVGADK